ncbi:MAG TPA: hypothetical protein VK633_12200 [Verrucomicrobiae bacterium]|nr:hypothetical protein [Verrucomicrobiae bacterium]
MYLHDREAAGFNIEVGEVTYVTLARKAEDDGKVFVPALSSTTSLVEGETL